MNAKFLICFLMLSLGLKAQQQRMPFQLYPETGYDFHFLNDNIYKGSRINRALQYGGGLQFGLSKKISLGLEYQMKKFSLEKNILSSYDAIIAADPLTVQYFEKSKLQNILLNLGWYQYSKKRRNLFQLNIGAGMQWLNQGKNILAFHNPNLLGSLDTIYQNGTKSKGYLTQIQLNNTFFLSKNIGLRIGVKAQYAPAAYQASYARLPNENNQTSFENLCNTEIVTVNTNFPVHVIPSVGIVVSFGGKDKPKDEAENKNKGTCIKLKWNNKPAKGNCFDGEKINFTIKQNNRTVGEGRVLQYKVYIAPYNDLSNRQLINTLSASETVFQISSALLNSGTRYVVIVETHCVNPKYNCIEFESPINQCNDPCKDKGKINYKKSR